MSIVDTPEKDFSNVDKKYDMIKVRTYSVNSSSLLFSFSICAMFNRVSRAKNQLLMLKSYIPGINLLIYPKIHYGNLLSEKLVN